MSDYEKSDVSIGGISGFAIGIVATVLVCGFGIWLAMRVLDRTTANGRSPETRSAQSGPPDFVEQGSGPHLQTDAPADLARFRAEEDTKLTSYGWVDRKAGVIRIPVERAMDLLAERASAKPNSAK
jgi:hypothetical protein